MHEPLERPADVPPERLAAALAQLCERDGLDPCQTACVTIEALAWTPALPRERKLVPRAAALDRSEAQVAEWTELIRQRAYEIWQAEGQPNGWALEHWCRAEGELAAPERRSVEAPAFLNARGT